MKSILGLIGLILVLSTILVPAIAASELDYRAGDWIRYKVTVTYGEKKCIFLVKVSVESVEGTLVKFTIAVEKLLSGSEHPECSQIASAPPSTATRNVSGAEPDGTVFVDSKYTGTYNVALGAKATYNKGVLVKLEREESYQGTKLSIIIELDDTSISWLKPWYMQPLFMIAIMAAVVAVIGAVVFIIIRRKIRALEQSLTPPPSPQPPTPPPPST